MTLLIREAQASDLPGIIALHAADRLGGHGDQWNETTRPAYEAAFTRITASPDCTLFVVFERETLLGSFQLTLIPTITGRGGLRAKVESVQVAEAARGHGIGAAMMAHAEHVARQAGAAFIELTSNKARVDAHRFYARLGYTASHLGFKKTLQVLPGLGPAPD